MRRAQVEEVEKYPKRLTIRLPKDLHEDLRWLSFETREPLQTMALGALLVMPHPCRSPA